MISSPKHSEFLSIVQQHEKKYARAGEARGNSNSLGYSSAPREIHILLVAGCGANRFDRDFGEDRMRWNRLDVVHSAPKFTTWVKSDECESVKGFGLRLEHMCNYPSCTCPRVQSTKSTCYSRLLPHLQSWRAYIIGSRVTALSIAMRSRTGEVVPRVQ